MASKKTVTIENLVALGAERLAGILMQVASGNAEIKRRLRLELAAESGGDSIAGEIAKRITTLRVARSAIDRQKARDVARDLDLQRAMIVDRVAPTRPDVALDLLWRFMDLAEPVLNRIEEDTGAVEDVFSAACTDLATIAARAKPDPVGLAGLVCAAVLNDLYGVCGELISGVFPVLGAAGVARLKEGLREAVASRPKGAGWNSKAEAGRRALQTLADEERDVDAYIALVPAAERSRSHWAAAIGRRLVAASRAGEALAALELARPAQQAFMDKDDELLFDGGSTGSVWEDVYLEALEASGQAEEAQRLRWAAFEERLSVEQLRAFLKRLPGFEDVEAEDRAKQYAFGFGSFAAALHFFHEWPDPAGAAQLVLTRTSEINGNLYFLLDPAAQLIEGRHPKAGTLLRRAMIEDTLNGTKASRYKHAARHLAVCASLAAGIVEADLETHAQFAARLRAKHGRKVGFWSLIGAAG